MNKNKIIKLWKQGYSVEQIINMSTMVRKNKGKDTEEKAKHYVKKLVEETILEYQS